MPSAPRYSSADPREEKDAIASLGAGDSIISKFFAAEVVVRGVKGNGMFASADGLGSIEPLRGSDASDLPKRNMGKGDWGTGRDSKLPLLSSEELEPF